jgi:transcriptional regulator with XRE-family HTH domain
MATCLAPVSGDDRDVVRCDYCLLIQFVSSSNNCRRCRRSLDDPGPLLAAPALRPAEPTLTVSETVARSIRELRLAAGLSQRQVAGRMAVPRSYVSKVENCKALPTLPSLERLARALGCSMLDVITPFERNRQRQRDEIMADPFLADLQPYIGRLSARNRARVLATVRDLPKRRALAS